MIARVLLAATLLVGGLMLVAMMSAARQQLQRRREARARGAVLTRRLAEVRRARASRQALPVAASAPSTAPTLDLLEQHTRFARMAAAPAPPRRMPKGSAPPPIPSAAFAGAARGHAPGARVAPGQDRPLRSKRGA